MGKKINVDEQYLDELITFSSKKMTGKIMKRFEILDNKNELKKAVKELLYEGWRDFKDVLVAHHYGVEMTVFDYTKSNHTQG